MAIYKYTAKTDEGKTSRGQMEAADENVLYGRLREQGLYMTSCKPVKISVSSHRLKAKVLTEYCRSLGQLLKAGVSLVRAQTIICQEETLKPAERKIYEDVLRSIRQGNPLSEAMEETGGAFPPLLVNMIRSAEASGSLDKVALRMAAHYEKEFKLKSKISGAMVYPCILLGLIVVVVLFIFSFVIPQFSDMFAQMDALPLATQIVMGASDFVKDKWYILIFIVLGLVFLWHILMRVPEIRRGKDKLKLKLPIFGKLLRIIYTARFSRTLSSLYSAGIPIVTALTIGRNTIGNSYIEFQFDEAIAKVRSGIHLSEAIDGIDGFIKKLSSSIMIGEETGSLDSMLDSIADTLDYESEAAINKMVSLMEPVLIIIMALIVGTIMIAVLMPIYGSYSSIENSAYY